MHDEQLVRGERELRVRLAADPASVPGARRFVADGLRAWGHDTLVDDAALCVSELAGNAALHGSCTYIEVSVLDLDGSVRVCVEDDGPAPAEAIMPRVVLTGIGNDFGLSTDDLDELDLLLTAPATGRGLAIVSVLASDWGVDDLATGKRVWAELCDSGDAPAPVSPVEVVTALAPAPDEPAPDRPAPGREALPEDWHVVRLLGCPVELSLRQDQHLDELVRELTLMSADRRNTASLELAQRLEAILRTPAHARAAGRRQSQAALEQGQRHIDVSMAMPRGFAAEVQLLHEAVAEADELCEQRRLLTLATSPEVRELRAWMSEQIVVQLEQGGTPTSWDDWQARWD